MPVPRRPLSERFWEKVQVAPALDCWLWTASLTPAGYGQISRGGRQGATVAYRVAYELMIGEIPAGLTLDHLCYERRCVNPYHLDPVPMSVNSKRSHARRLSSPNPRTHCKNGHELTPETAPFKADGWARKSCLICSRAWNAARRENRKKVQP